MKKFKVHTLGCKVNQCESQSIRERFLQNNFHEALHNEEANVCIINTCSVTARADQKSRNLIRHSIKNSPKAKIIVTGCLVQRDLATLRKIKGISVIISKKFFPDSVSDFCGHTRAFLKIQDGCNNFCSYCKVPLIRGGSTSVPLDKIILQAEKLAGNGFKEIVLTGICLGAYGKDLGGKINLVDAIDGLEKIKGLLRIRLSSIEAKDVTQELIKKMAQSQKLCRHLHIPMQSGDNAILKKMNRRYTREDYLNLIKQIKTMVPGVAITTDIIVGFPGEKEGSFENTVRLVKEIAPLKTHIFPYSSREGTASFSLKEKIDRAEIERRIQLLNQVSDESADAFRKQFLHKKMDVLIEGRAKDSKDFWEGYTDNYIKVMVPIKTDVRNEIIPVLLKEIKNDFMISRLK